MFYGSGAGLSGDQSELWSQDSPGVPDQSEVDDRFGGALAMGDIDADGDDDLAVAAYTEDPGPAVRADARSASRSGARGRSRSCEGRSTA